MSTQPQPHSPIPTPLPAVSSLLPQPISRTSSAGSIHSSNSASPSNPTCVNPTNNALPQQPPQPTPIQTQPPLTRSHAGHSHPQLAPITIPPPSSPSSVHITGPLASPTSIPGSPTRGRSGSIMGHTGGPASRASTSHPHGHVTRKSISGTESILRTPTTTSEGSSTPGAAATPTASMAREGSTSSLGTSLSSEHVLSNNAEDYEVRNPIGYGSSAVVYNALYKPTNKRVAIKMIDLDMFERNQIDELRRETALMALSKHPNVLRVYGSFVKGSKLYIVTPYLSGGSCLDIMKNAFPDGFDEISIATIMRQALEGILYLHRNGHIHRDVKAGNLLMDEDGQVLLADFGVSSSLVENGEKGVRKTFVGTPCWMAPEVMEQAGYDYKADIWSFGITAIELATGHAPFAKFPPLKVLMLTLSNDPPTLDREATKHKYSKQLKEMIDMCLQKDPNKRPTAERLLQHSFFRQAKRKDYLVKTLLHGLPPLEQRPHKRLHHKHNSVGNMNIENWDFGGEAKRKDNGESLSSSTITDAEWETEEPEQITELRKSQNNTESNGRGGVTFDLPSVEPKTELKPNAPPPPKKHISFGEVVVKNPPYPAAPSQPQAFASPDTATPPIAPVAQPSRRSRFVFEESHLPAPASNAVPTTPTMTTSEHVVPTTTAVTLFSPPPPTLFHALMAPSTLSASESRVEPQDKPLVGLGLVNNGAGSKEITAPPGSALVTPGNQEVRKGRFSVTEGAVHPRSTTPGLEGSGDVVVGGVSGLPTLLKSGEDKSSASGLMRVGSTDNLMDRKSRFELQHQNSIPSSQLPPPLPTSATGPLQPGPTIPMQRVDGVPLSREGSFSSTASLTRGDGLAAKVSRFSVESRHEVHMKETVVENTSVVVVEGKERECKKKGRFELSNAEGLYVSAHTSDSPGSSSLSGSPATSPSSSLSRGQASRLLDSSSMHLLSSHLETLFKQNESQRAVLAELFGLAGLRGASGSGAGAGKILDFYPPVPPSPAFSQSSQSTTIPNGAAAGAGAGPHRYVYDGERRISEDGGMPPPHADILLNMHTINNQVQSVLRENELLKRENEAFRRELDRLRRAYTVPTTVVTTPSPNISSATLPNVGSAPTSTESNAQSTNSTSSISQLK